MADENLNAGENTEVITEGTPQMSDVEVEARESGWVPEADYTGDKNKWIDAAEFVRRGPLFKKIDSQSREIKAMRQAISDIQALHEKSRESEYKKALAEVRAEKRAALLDGDADAVIEADEKLDMLKEAQREAPLPAQASQGQDHPEFVAWVSKNSWYENHKGMKAFADTVGGEYRAQGMSPSEVLKAVERDVRKEFPNRFVNPNQAKPNAVEGGSNAPVSSGGKDNMVLSETERSIMNNLVRLGVMTSKEYIAELKKTREV